MKVKADKDKDKDKDKVRYVKYEFIVLYGLLGEGEVFYSFYNEFSQN